MRFGFIFIEIISGLMFCNAQQTGTNIFGILLSQPDADTCGLVGHSQPGEQLKGCPPEIPLTDDEHKIIVAARIYADAGWNYAGTDVAELACNGACQDIEAEAKFTAPTGSGFGMGSVIINPGCTMLVFSEYNYAGGALKRFPAGVHVNIEIKAPLHRCSGPGGVDVACAHSMLFTCTQVYPSCTPLNNWQTVTTLDNSNSTIESQFSYKKTIGTEFSQAITNSFGVSLTIKESISASFYGLFSASSSLSATTHYDWKKMDTEEKSSATTYNVEVTVPPGLKVFIEEVVGTCDGSKIHTQMFRVQTTNNKTIKQHQGKMYRYSLRCTGCKQPTTKL